MRLWERERGNMRVFCFIISEDFVIGHYTQFVWAETTKVGCGILISKVGFNELNIIIM